MPLLLLFDWSNYVFAMMDAVIERFMASDIAGIARDLVQEFNEQTTLDFEVARHARNQLEAKLRKLLGRHATEYKTSIYQTLRQPRELPLEFVGGTDAANSTGTDTSCSDAAQRLSTIIQQQPAVHLVVVTDAGKRDRWKTQQRVVNKALELGENLGVGADEFAGEVAALEAAMLEQQNAYSQANSVTALPVQQQRQPDTSLAELQHEAASDQQLDSDVVYRLKGALLFIARYTLGKALEPAKPLLIPGCIADEAIAAVVHANSVLQQPLQLCIKSDDSDFWQLRCYCSCNHHSTTADQQQACTSNAAPAAPASSDTKECSSSSSSKANCTAHPSSATTSSSSSTDTQWLYHCGIKWDFTYTAASMPQHHLHKCAILGKGREELTHYGTVFGPVPDGVEVMDAAGTAVLGQHRPGDALYREQFVAFDAAARTAEPWTMDVQEVLEWLQQFRHQVPAIRARFLIKMVQHNINPYNEWSAMPQDLQETCRKAAADVLATAETLDGSSSSSRAGSSATAPVVGSSYSGGSVSALAAAACKAAVSTNKKNKIVRRRR